MTIEELHYNDPLQELSTEGSGPYRVFYSKRSTDEEAAFDAETIGGKAPFRIPNNSYFVMGDNRDNSLDSRYRGPVPRALIWGKPVMIYYSATMQDDEPRWDRMFKRIH